MSAPFTPRRAAPKHVAGLTLIELITSLALLCTVMAVALPSVGAWSRNGKAHDTADVLQAGLERARLTAIQRNQQVVFSLTDEPPALGATAVVNGKNWVARTVPEIGEAAQFIGGGPLTSAGSDMALISDWASICFNGFGRLVANKAPGAAMGKAPVIAAGSCELPTADHPVAYDFTAPNARPGVDRRYRITVSLSGQIRMCDANRAPGSSTEAC